MYIYIYTTEPTKKCMNFNNTQNLPFFPKNLTHHPTKHPQQKWAVPTTFPALESGTTIKKVATWEFPASRCGAERSKLISDQVEAPSNQPQPVA